MKVRKVTAREEAMKQYAAAHDRFSELEQRHSGKNAAEASGAHEFARFALRAYRGELDNHEPAAPAPCPFGCRECAKANAA